MGKVMWAIYGRLTSEPPETKPIKLAWTYCRRHAKKLAKLFRLACGADWTIWEVTIYEL